MHEYTRAQRTDGRQVCQMHWRLIVPRYGRGARTLLATVRCASEREAHRQLGIRHPGDRWSRVSCVSCSRCRTVVRYYVIAVSGGCEIQCVVRFGVPSYGNEEQTWMTVCFMPVCDAMPVMRVIYRFPLTSVFTFVVCFMPVFLLH